jgi:hypothetical protein
MKAYGGVDVWIYIFLTSGLAGGEWSASQHGRSTPVEKAPGTHWIGGLVNTRAGLNKEKRKFLTFLGLELRPLGGPSRSQSLYRLAPLLPAVGDFVLYFSTSRLALVSTQPSVQWIPGSPSLG